MKYSISQQSKHNGKVFEMGQKKWKKKRSEEASFFYPW